MRQTWHVSMRRPAHCAARISLKSHTQSGTHKVPAVPAKTRTHTIQRFQAHLGGHAICIMMPPAHTNSTSGRLSPRCTRHTAHTACSACVRFRSTAGGACWLVAMMRACVPPQPHAPVHLCKFDVGLSACRAGKHSTRKQAHTQTNEYKETNRSTRPCGRKRERPGRRAHSCWRLLRVPVLTEKAPECLNGVGGSREH